MVHAKIRVINNIVNSPKLDIHLNREKSFINVEYRGIYPYSKIKPGNYTINVCISGNSNSLISGKIVLNMNTYYTLIFFGTSIENIRISLLENSRSLPIRGKSQIRFFHATSVSQVPQKVDVYLNNATRLFSSIDYGFVGVPEYLTLDSGLINLSLTLKDELDVISGPFTLQLMDRNYTIISTGLIDNQNSSLGIIVLIDFPIENKCGY